MEEVGRPVERIDDPPRLAGIAGNFAGLFHQEAPARPDRAEFVVNRALGGLIGLGDEVGRPLAAHLEVFDLTEIATQAAGRPCGQPFPSRG